MQRDLRCYLEDMAQACANIKELTASKSLEEFLLDRQLRWAVERQLTVLGEALY